MRYLRILAAVVLPSILLAAALAAASPARPAAAPKATFTAVDVSEKGVISAEWKLAPKWCSFSFEVLNESRTGRIYEKFLPCGAKAHKTTAFNPGPQNQPKVLWIRIQAIPEAASADCLKNRKQPLCLNVSRSAPRRVVIKPRATVQPPTTGTGANSPAFYDGAYQVFFKVTDSGTPLAKKDQQLGPLDFSVKSLKMSGDFSGDISQATGKASGDAAILGLACRFDVGFKKEGAEMKVNGSATCNQGLITGSIEGKRK